MKSNYDVLGNHIQLVDVRNRELITERVLGISIDKAFMPSVANVIGTDLSKYKLLEKGRFACNPMHVGRDERLPVALYEEDVPAIVSPACFMFEVIDSTILNEEYLMMWLRRPEFDRECWFHTDGSVRGGILWEDICRLEIPIPSIEKQREIVAAYRAISDRIELKKKINNNLADTISAHFIHIYNETSEETSKSLEDVCTLASSKRIFADEYVSNGIPFYRGKEITMKQAGEPITDPLYIAKDYFDELKSKYGSPDEGDILLTAVGTIGNSYFVKKEDFYFKDGNIIWLKNFKDSLNFYIYDFMQTEIFKRMLDGICIGSTQTALTIVSLSKLQIKIPAPDILAKYTLLSKTVRNQIEKNVDEIYRLHEMQSVLLANLSR